MKLLRPLQFLIELATLAIVIATPGAWPRLGALLLVLSRWIAFFVARGSGRDVPAAIVQAIVPVFGLIWLELGTKSRAQAPSSGDAAVGDEDDAEGEVPPEELLQLNVQLMAKSLSDELAGASVRARAVSPLVDVASGADYRAKQGAVIRLRGLRTLQGVDALKSLRGQSDPDLQYLAATALASLEQSESAAILAGEERVLEFPRDFAARVEVALARIFLCQSGLLGGSMATSHLARAAEHLTEARPLARSDAERAQVTELLAQACELQGRETEARELLEALAPRSAEGLERLARLQLAHGRHEGLRKTCDQIILSVPGSDPLHEAAVAWRSSHGL